jgi:prevent-host-death family protein
MRSEVRIAQFKSKLSQYLRAAQRGNEIIIKDRETPVARLLPYEPPGRRFVTRPPLGSLKDLQELARPPRPKKLTVRHLDEALQAERQRDRLNRS